MTEPVPSVSLGSLQLQVADIRAISRNQVIQSMASSSSSSTSPPSSSTTMINHQQAVAAANNGNSIIVSTASTAATTVLTKVTLLESVITTEPSTTTTMATTIVAHNNNMGGPHQLQLQQAPNSSNSNLRDPSNSVQSESPKRSIFDGASKDEILTYLEDARERVPELLMAADEVMVLGDNELLLVNQLNPGSPATPISIVGSDDIISSSGELMDDDDEAGRVGAGGGAGSVEEHASIEQAMSAISTSSSVVLVDSYNHHNHNHHPMIGCSMVVDPPSSLDDQIRLFSDVDIKRLSRGNSSKHRQQAIEQDSLDSVQLQTLELDEHPHSQLAFMSLPLASQKNHGQQTDNETQPAQTILNNENNETNDTLQQHVTTTTTSGRELVPQGAAIASGSASCQLYRPSLSSISSSNDQDHQDEPGEATAAAAADMLNAHLCISERVTSMLRRSSRRKSTSENTGQSAEAKRAIRLMMLQKCHSKTHDSISTTSSSSKSSSASSTPASCSSSTSNSRSSSSNHTSGNCSGGTSNFYTSPSLSCSSPFLGGLNVGTNYTGFQAIPSTSSGTHRLPSMAHHHHTMVPFSQGNHLAQLATSPLELTPATTAAAATSISSLSASSSTTTTTSANLLTSWSTCSTQLMSQQTNLEQLEENLALTPLGSSFDRCAGQTQPIPLQHTELNSDSGFELDVTTSMATTTMITPLTTTTFTLASGSPRRDSSSLSSPRDHTTTESHHGLSSDSLKPYDALEATIKGKSSLGGAYMGLQSGSTKLGVINEQNQRRSIGVNEAASLAGNRNSITTSAGSTTCIVNKPSHNNNNTCDTTSIPIKQPISNLARTREFSFASTISGSSPSSAGGGGGKLGPARPTNSQYATINKLNNYLFNRYRSCANMVVGSGGGGSDLAAHLSSSGSPQDGTGPLQAQPSAASSSSAQTQPMVEFQCLDCDQFIVTDHARVLHKANELRLLRESEIESLENSDRNSSQQLMSLDQIDRAYVVALNGLPLCHYCEKKRTERKEIISEFLETEQKYGQDLKIIHDEFYRPMQIAGLLNKDQINGIFSNLDELIMAHCRFAERLQAATVQAQAIGDTDYNTVNIGKLFVESADMLHTFESYCIRQASAACLLARLAKEKELLRIFLRVSQMENTLLRRMNLAAFLMVPVQRVTKYPLLLNRLYKVTAYHHKDREALRDAQLKVELHLEHINQQTKGISATNKIWRRISNLSGQTIANANSTKRGLISAEDIGYIKLRNTAMELLKWDRDETQFIHSGKINWAPLNEYLVKQKMKSFRYMPAHALLIVLGKPNWRYRPDLVKSHVDYKQLTPTPGGNGIREAALLLFREKNGRFIACREPLFLTNCVLSNDCSQYNIETSIHSTNQSKQQHHSNTSSTSSSSAAAATTTTAANSTTSLTNATTVATTTTAQQQQASGSSSVLLLMSRRSSPSTSGLGKRLDATGASLGKETRAASADGQPEAMAGSGSGGGSGSHHQAANASAAPAPNNSSSAQSRSDCQKSDQAGSEGRTMQSKSFSISKDSDVSEQGGGSGGGGDSISMSSLKSLPEERSRRSRQSSPPPPQAARSYSLASAFSQSSTGSTSSTSSLNPTKTSPSGTLGTSNLHIKNPFKSKASANSNQNNNSSNQQQNSSAASNKSHLASGVKIECCASSGQVKASPASGHAADGMANILMSKTHTLTQGAMQDNQSNLANSVLANGRLVGFSGTGGGGQQSEQQQQHHLYNHHFFFHNHHQPYGDYEESFEIHERLSKESLLLRADTPLKTRYWLQMLRYHAKDLGHWRQRRAALANIMMMRQE